MKQEQKIYAVVGLLVVLAGAFYVVTSGQKKDSEAHSGQASGDLPEIKLSKEDTDKVTKLTVSNKDKGTVTLERNGDKWQITAPIKAPANAQNVKSALENLQKVSFKSLVASSAEVHEKYELSEGKGVRVQAFAGDVTAFDVVFGKRGTRGAKGGSNMARLGATDAKADVYAAIGYASQVWSKELKGWRHNEIATFEDGNVIAIEVENAHGKLSFTKSEESWAHKFYKRNKRGKLGAGKAIERFDEQKVKDMLRAFKGLKATDFADAGADTGVEAPLDNEGGIVRVTMKDGTEPKYVFKAGKAQEGSNRYLALEGDATVYVVGSWTTDWATAEVSKFQKPEEKADADKKGGDAPGMPGMPGMPGATKPAAAGPAKK